MTVPNFPKPNLKSQVRGALTVKPVSNAVRDLGLALANEDLELKSFSITRPVEHHAPDGYVGALWGVEVIAVD